MDPTLSFFVAACAATAVVLAFLVAFFRAWRARGAPRRAGWILAGNALLCLFVAAVAVAGIEGAYRFGYDTTDGANRSLLSRRWFERHWDENAHGVRDDVELEPARRPGVPRVTFLGDSYTAAQGVPDVADRFANRIRRARAGWDVQVLARNGLGTVHEIELLAELLAAGWEPDVVVLVYCYNDIDPLIPELRQFLRTVKQEPEGVAAWLADVSLAGNLLVHRRLRAQASHAPDGRSYWDVRADAYRGEPWEAQRRALRDLAHTVREAGGRLLAVTFPWPRGRGDGGEAMRAGLAAAWAELGVPHLDLTEAFALYSTAELEVNRLDNHPSVLAHRVAAEALLPFLDVHVPGR